MNRGLEKTRHALSFVFAWTFCISSASAVTSDDFQLVGPDGKVTARLTTSKEGTPALFFYDQHGKNRQRRIEQADQEESRDQRQDKYGINGNGLHSIEGEGHDDARQHARRH